MTDGELTALQLVLGRQFSVERDGDRVLVTLRRYVPLVTWSLTPADGAANGPRLTEWVEHLGGTAATALREIGADAAAEPERRIERIVEVTARSAQAFGDDYRVVVDAVHSDDPDDWFR